MNLVQWFNVYKKEHIMAYQYLMENGHWPVTFIPEGMEIPEMAIRLIETKIADAWICYFLQD